LEINSLPVPVSPKIKTVASVAATVSTACRSRRRAALSPMIPAKFDSGGKISLTKLLPAPCPFSLQPHCHNRRYILPFSCLPTSFFSSLHFNLRRRFRLVYHRSKVKNLYKLFFCFSCSDFTFLIRLARFFERGFVPIVPF
jgi:hypothetical protein